MPAPDEARALAALQAVQALRAPELEAWITERVGRPMMGILNSMAKAAYPEDTPDERARKVHLMVSSYLMCSHVEGMPASR